jgi:integrase
VTADTYALALDVPVKPGDLTEDMVIATMRRLREAGKRVSRPKIAEALNVEEHRTRRFIEPIQRELIIWLDELIQRDVSEGDRRKWLDDCLNMVGYWCGGPSHLASPEQETAMLKRYVQIGVQLILPEKRLYNTPTQTDFIRKLGYWCDDCAPLLHEYLTEIGLAPIYQAKKGSPEMQNFSVHQALPRIVEDLHHIPLTWLDDHKKYNEPDRVLLLRVYNIQHTTVRQWAFLALLIRSRAPHCQFSTMFSKLVEIFYWLGYKRNDPLDALDMEHIIKSYLEEKISGLEESQSSRLHNVSMYFNVIDTQNEWFRKLTSAQKDRYRNYLVPAPESADFYKKGGYFSDVREKQQERRKDEVAPVADNFYQLRFLIDIRFNELARMRQGALDAISEIRQGASMPYVYHYDEETYGLDARKINVRRYFVLWNRRTLYKERIRRAKETGQEFSVTFSKKVAEYESSGDDIEEFFVQYVRTEDNAQRTIDDYWFIELARNGILQSVPNPSARLWLKAHGYAESAFRSASGILGFRTSASQFAANAQEDLNITLVPYEELYTTGLFGRAMMRLATTTGARLGELSQITPDPKTMVEVTMPSGKKATAFLAVPKGLKAPRSFYMDEPCLEAIASILRRHRELEMAGYGGLVRGKPPPHLERKCGSAKYIFQLNGRSLEAAQFNGCLRFMLHGVEFRNSSGERYSLSSHFLRHAFATEMRKQGVEVDILAELLNQKWVEITRYYSKPTPTTVQAAAERSFITRITFQAKDGVRKPDEILQQMKDAEGKIGALTNVLGGTCTERGFCPAKFQCIGCASNAPDPTQDDTVLLKKRHAEEWLRMARKQGLTSEINSALSIIRDCDEMLEEMKLMNIASENSSQVIRIRGDTLRGSNR